MANVYGDSAVSIFQQQCAKCHGADGQGVDDGYNHPLFGDRSIDSLARLIERTMPENDPELCRGEEARQVAAYIFREFYSPEARQKKGLVSRARVELARLTVPQYRNAVADLVGHFTPAPADGSQGDEEQLSQTFSPAAVPGLRGDYFQSERMNKTYKLGDRRIDRRIAFDYAAGSPAEDITADQFAIIWQGALVADDTGHYEFRVRTQNGARFYVNCDPIEHRKLLNDVSEVDGKSALIDAWVSSGQMREHTARIFLLGGRQYPLRLEFFKYLDKTASITLEWKPPRGTWSVLGSSHLATSTVPRVFVVHTPFPADDRSHGYERGSSISQQWQAAITNAAVATASEVVNRLPLLSGADKKSADRKAKLKDFVAQFARVAFRRPLADAEDRWFRETVFADAPNPEMAVRRAVLRILNSPHFLYTEMTPAGQAPTQYTIAARLSFALWDSIPDQRLFDAADGGQLNSAERIQAQARPMLDSPLARAKMRRFFHHWLEIEQRDLAKDKQLFPEFDDAVIADLRFSLDRFLQQVLWSKSSDYRQLLQADYLLVNDRLRHLYGPRQPHDNSDDDSHPQGGTDQDDQPGAEFNPVTFSAGRRAGVLTHPYLLSAFAYHNSTSPIHRGVFLTRNIIGRALKSPPVAVEFNDEKLKADLTMREKITQLTRDNACMSCHKVINPLGFALENYDAIGRWRTSDNSKPVQATSEYATVEGEVLQFRSARDVANFAANSKNAHQAFVIKLFQYTVKQNPGAYGRGTVDRLCHQFANDNFNIQNLLVRIAALTAAQGHPAPSESKSTP